MTISVPMLLNCSQRSLDSRLTLGSVSLASSPPGSSFTSSWLLRALSASISEWRWAGIREENGAMEELIRLANFIHLVSAVITGYQGVPALIGPAGADALLTPGPGLVWQVWQVSTRTDTGAVSSARGRHGERQREPREW